MRFAGLVAAARLGVYDALVEPRTAEDVAAWLQLDPVWTRWLLLALAGEGVLARDGDAFVTNAAVTPVISDEPGADLLVALFRERRPLAWSEVLGNLDAVALTVPPAEDVEGIAEAVAAALAPVLAAGGMFVDLGCGVGILAAAVLAAAPRASGWLVDRPMPLARAAAVLGDLRGRVELQAADLAVVEPPRCQAALLARVLHVLPASEAADLVKRAAAALLPGGVLAVVETESGVEAMSPGAAWFGLSLLVHGLPELVPSDQVRRWLAAAGLVDLVVRPIPSEPRTYIVTGWAPASGLVID